MKNYLILCGFLFLSLSLFGQNKATRDGDDFFNKRMYKEALKSYLNAADGKGKDSFYLNQQIAKTYNRLFDYQNAHSWYSKLNSFPGENTAKNLYEYGQVLRNLEMYDLAKDVFSDYANLGGSSIKQSELQALCDWPLANLENKQDDIEISKTNIETGSRSIGCAFYKGGLAYAKPQTDKYESQTTYYDLAYLRSKNKINFSSPTVLPGSINQAFYDGAPSFSKGGKTLYFTSNSSESQKLTSSKKGDNKFSNEGVNVLKIYSTQMKDGTWTPKQELNFNNSEFSCAFPHISEDGQTLYFASDMPGGYGMMDIYYVTKTGESTWSQPLNLGPEVNTFENETYPFILDSHFYFSSKGKPGFGGSDIFKGSLSNNNVSDIENMGMPINSPKDDFGFIVNQYEDEGYFSSNREGSNGYDYIYYFEKVEKVAKKRKKKSKPITAVKIEIQRPEPVVEVAPPPPPPEPEQVAPKVGQVIVLNNIYFDFDRSTIRKESYPILDNLANILIQFPSTVIELSAHTDAAGDDDYNMDLSHDRAKACHKYLIAKGINPQRIIPIGYGETRLVNDCKNWRRCSSEENQLNRRVEVKFLSPLN